MVLHGASAHVFYVPMMNQVNFDTCQLGEFGDRPWITTKSGTEKALLDSIYSTIMDGSRRMPTMTVLPVSTWKTAYGPIEYVL